MDRPIFEEDHELFRDTFKQFVEKEMVPYNEIWEENGIVAVSYTHLTLPTK